MRIVTLQPFLTDVVSHLGLSAELVGVSHECDLPAEGPTPCVLTSASASPGTGGIPDIKKLVAGLARAPVDSEKLFGITPDLVLTALPDPGQTQFCSWAEGVIERELGKPVKVRSFSIRSLEMMYEAFEEIGVLVGKAREGRELANRIKAQLMVWGDSFYDRMKNKRVTVLSSVSPLRVAGRWVPDIIKTASAQPQMLAVNELDAPTTWAEVATFRPDVLVVAPEGASLQESVKTLPTLERVAQWSDLPAVKRGEVIFCEGTGLYRPGPKILTGAAVLFSAIAGLESGYITKRDEFFRLRFVELHRHRFL